MAEITNLTPMSPALQGSKGYEAVFVVSFLFLFLIALVAQLLFLRWRSWFPGAESEKSLIKGVRAGVYTFMSYLN
jgi:light-harvesting complex 1 beta chain